MDSKPITSQSKRYSHLSMHEREMFFAEIARGNPVGAIAKMLGRHPSTLYRERARNFYLSNRYRYSPTDADRKYHRRLTRARRRPRLKTPLIRAYTESKLRLRWSPEIIAGRLSIDHPGISISHEAIYQYIYYYRRSYIKWLAQSHIHRRKRRKRANYASNWAQRTSIELRDSIVDTRLDVGHWEADTVVSRKSHVALAIVYERSTRLVRIRRIPRNTAKHFSHAVLCALTQFPKRMKKTITYDNGSENALHYRIDANLGTRSFFCHPYAAWERPGVEQCIGRLRVFIPKGTDLATTNRYQLRYIQDLLNNRPRKCLGFITPNEAFKALALSG